MRKCQELATALATEYQEMTKNKQAPRLVLSLKDKKEEGYISSYAAGKLSIIANNSLSQAFAISQLCAAVNARHLAEFLGEIKPRYALRPLWLKATNEISFGKGLSIHLPEFMIAEDAELLIPRLCKRLIECGYNAILIGSHFNCWEEENPKINELKIDLNAMLKQLHEHGIQVILKPNVQIDFNSTSLTKNLKSSLENIFNDFYDQFSNVDYIFWESLWLTSVYQNDPKALLMTDSEMLLEEIRLLEQNLVNKSKLIFYMSAPRAQEKECLRHARWMINLLDDMHQNSMIAFNAVCGYPHSDHQCGHPIWELLRESPDCSSTPLLPVLNIGLVNQGEGLWPIINADLLDRFLPRCSRHHFAGALSMASHMPRSGSVLDCNLWVAGQSLWRDISPLLLLETWFKAFRSDENLHFCLKAMKCGRDIAMQLCSLSPQHLLESLSGEESKIYGDHILSSLKQLQNQWKKQIDKKSLNAHPKIKDYFNFFAKDVKQLLGAYLPTYNIPLSYLIDNEEPSISFWNAKLDTPNRGHKNSIMEAIYLENRYL